MNRREPLIVAIWIALLGIICPSAGPYQRKPAEPVEKLYELLGKGEIEGTEKFFLLFPNGSSASDASMFKSWLESLAQDLKRRGGIRSLQILSQDAVGGRAEVRFEYTLSDGTTRKESFDVVYDNDQWKILVDPTKSLQLDKEIAAVISVRAITKAQIMYSITKGHGKFTDLVTLGKVGLIDSELASGEKQGYLFASKPVFAKNRPAMFDTTARPKQLAGFGMGSRSYYCNETAVVYKADGGTAPAATASNRVPKNGSVVEE